MKVATSSWNAYAESYVPLSKRGSVSFNGQKAFKPRDEFVALGPHLWYPAVQVPPQIHNFHNIDAYYSCVNSGLMGHAAVHGYGGLSSSNPSAVKDKVNERYMAGDSSEKLPDTLDIGDVPKSRIHRELPFQKMKDINIEVGSSSSGVSG